MESETASLSFAGVARCFVGLSVWGREGLSSVKKTVLFSGILLFWKAEQKTEKKINKLTLLNNSLCELKI